MTSSYAASLRLQAATIVHRVGHEKGFAEWDSLSPESRRKREELAERMFTEAGIIDMALASGAEK